MMFMGIWHFSCKLEKAKSPFGCIPSFTFEKKPKPGGDQTMTRKIRVILFLTFATLWVYANAYGIGGYLFQFNTNYSI